VELTVLYLNRIQAYDRHGIHLNAVIVDNPAALADAAAADAARAGGRRRPLLGVPYTIKDSYKAKGLTVAAGSPAFAHLIANEDAFTVARVRAAGGVLLGKTNMPPLAAGGCRRASMAARKALTTPIISPPRGTRARPTVRAAPPLQLRQLWPGRRDGVLGPLALVEQRAGGLYALARGDLDPGNWPLYPIKDVVVPMTRSVNDMFEVLDVIVADDPVTRGDFWRDQKAVALPAASSVRPAHYADLARPDALRGKRIGVPTMYIGKDPTGKPIRVRPRSWRCGEKTADALRAAQAPPWWRWIFR
jgi:amidase